MKQVERLAMTGTSRTGGRLHRPHVLRQLTLVAALVVQVCFTAGSLQAETEYLDYLLWGSHSEGYRARVDGSALERLGDRDLFAAIAFDPSASKVYWGTSFIPGVTNGRIWRSNLDGSQPEVVLETSAAITNLALDTGGGKIYWSDKDELNVGAIQRADLDGGNIELLIGGLDNNARPVHIDLDLTSALKKVYFTLGSSVWVMDLDGQNATVSAPGISNLRGVAFSPSDSKLYVGTSNPSAAVQRCDLDGQNLETLFTGLGVQELDVLNAQVYFSDDGTVYVMDLDGGNQQTLVTFSIIGSPFALDFASSYAFGLNSHRIHRIDLDGNNEISVVAAFTDLHDVAMAADGGEIFWSSGDGTHDVGIIRTRLDGKEPNYIHSDPGPFDHIRGLVLDPVAEQLYFVTTPSSSGQAAVRRINTDGSGLVDLVAGLDGLHDLAIDVAGDRIYWTGGIESGSGPGATISAAQLDGTLLPDLATDLPQSIRGLAFDPTFDRLYFTDHANDRIGRIDTSGSNLILDLVAATKPHDLAVDDETGTLYWTEGISSDANPTGKIRKSDLDGGNISDVLTGLSSELRDLTLVRIPAQIFADDFEAGDTTAWSAAVGGS